MNAECFISMYIGNKKYNLIELKKGKFKTEKERKMALYPLGRFKHLIKNL